MDTQRGLGKCLLHCLLLTASLAMQSAHSVLAPPATNAPPAAWLAGVVLNAWKKHDTGTFLCAMKKLGHRRREKRTSGP